MAPEQAEWQTIWMGVSDTAEADGWYPVEPEVRFNELSAFEVPSKFGPTDKDSDTFISSYIMGDFSGGGQIERITGSDSNRYHSGIIEAIDPNAITLPPLVQEISIGASGTCYVVGSIGEYVYAIRGTNLYPVDATADPPTVGSGEAIAADPAGKAVKWRNGGGADDALYIPYGSAGYVRVTESAPGNPVIDTYNGVSTPAASTGTDSPDAVAFAIHDGRIWALSTAGALCYSFTGDDGDWVWIYDEARAWFPRPIGDTPKRLVSYFNREGVPSLWIITDRGAYIFDPINKTINTTSIQFPPHPDFGRAAAVWRPGEDLHIGAGLDTVRYTPANVVVPHSGLSRDDGLPYDKFGKIVDLVPELSALYALVCGSSVSVESFAYDSKFGADGTGDGQFNTPKQIALDSSGNIYVADSGNDRVIKFNSSGVFQSNIITSVDQVRGLCIDSSDNIYISYQASSNYHVAKYNSAGTVQWASAGLSSVSSTLNHLATDGTSVYVTDSADSEGVRKFACSDGTASTVLIGPSGSGDGEFDTPYGIAYSAVTGTLYVVDQGNDRVQEITTTGTFVRKWGTSGTDDGEFTLATGIAVNPNSGNIFVLDSGRDDFQVFSPAGVFLRKFGASGTGNGQFATPDGIVVGSTDDVWVSDTQSGDDRIQKIATTTDSTVTLTAKPLICKWTGTGWHEVWEGDNADDQLNWGEVLSTPSSYRLWWGDDNGVLYSMPLRRTLHNPRHGWQAGIDRFATTGRLITGRWDALMAGFEKLADRMVIFLDNATATEYITVEYQFDTEGTWYELGTANAVGRNVLPFNVDGDNFSWGQRFNWIQFRFNFFRGSNAYQTPVLFSANLHYRKRPQQAQANMFTIPFPKRRWKGRTGNEIQDGLKALLNAEEMVKLVHRDTVYRGSLIAVAGLTATGRDYSGGATVNFVELRADRGF